MSLTGASSVLFPHIDATKEQNTVVHTTPIAAGIADKGSKYVMPSVTAKAVFCTPTTKVMALRLGTDIRKIRATP